MFWELKGAKASTGREVCIWLDAPTRASAEAYAQRRGIYVSSLNPVSRRAALLFVGKVLGVLVLGVIAIAGAGKTDGAAEKGVEMAIVGLGLAIVEGVRRRWPGRPSRDLTAGEVFFVLAIFAAVVIGFVIWRGDIFQNANPPSAHQHGSYRSYGP